MGLALIGAILVREVAQLAVGGAEVELVLVVDEALRGEVGVYVPGVGLYAVDQRRAVRSDDVVFVSVLVVEGLGGGEVEAADGLIHALGDALRVALIAGDIAGGAGGAPLHNASAVERARSVFHQHGLAGAQLPMLRLTGVTQKPAVTEPSVSVMAL